MHKRRLVCLILLLAALSAGCSVINYRFDGSLYRREQAQPLAAAVDLFQDLRTPDEHDGTFSATKRFLYTNDEMFGKDIEKRVSNLLVKHLKKARIVDEVVLRDFDDDLFENPEKMAALNAEGFDVAVQGDLYHLYGYRSGAGAAAFFGLAGVLTEVLTNHKVVGGRAAYGEVKFIDLKRREVLWQGSFSYDYEEKDIFYDDVTFYAVKALKEVNDRLAQKLDEVVHAP